jgi:hypothetical protein
MTLRPSPVRWLLVLSGTLVATITGWTDDPKGKSGKDPAGTTLIMGQLRLMFDRWDKNKDGYLDSAELAKAFRGASARPHLGDGKIPGDKTAAKYPDYQFLIQLDQDHDGKISTREFEDWARSYAKGLNSQQRSSSTRSSQGQKASSTKASGTTGQQTTAQADNSANKAVQQIEKQLITNQKQQLHYLQEIEKQLKHAKH